MGAGAESDPATVDAVASASQPFHAPFDQLPATRAVWNST